MDKMKSIVKIVYYSFFLFNWPKFYMGCTGYSFIFVWKLIHLGCTGSLIIFFKLVLG